MSLPIYEVVELCVEYIVAACIEAEDIKTQRMDAQVQARSAEHAADSWLTRKLKS